MTSKGPLRRFVGLLLAGPFAVLLLVLGASPASAHATLESTTPAQGTQLGAAPKDVEVSLSEEVAAGPRSLQVFDARGRRVDDGRVEHPDGDGRRVRVGVRDLGTGSYTVVWRVVSVDGHPVSGTFAFGVGVPAGTPPAAVTADPAVSFVRGVGQFASYAGAALVLGGSLVLFWLWPAGQDRPRMRRVLVAGVALAIAGSLLALLVQGPYVAGRGLGAVVDPGLLGETAGSSYGRPLLLRVLAAVLSVPTLGIWPRLPEGEDAGPGGVAAAGNLVLLAASFALTGHAAEASPRLLAEAADGLHLAAAGVWIGGLVVLGAAVLPDAPQGDLRALLPRWSAVAAGCVAVLVVTGLYQGWREVQPLASATSTRYGVLLLVKLGVVALALLVALGARRLVGRLASSGASVTRLRTLVGVEAVLGVGVLGVTSVLVATPPARTSYAPAWSASVPLQDVQGDAARVAVTVKPARAGAQTLRLEAFTGTGAVLPFTSATGRLTRDGAPDATVTVAFVPEGAGRAVSQNLVVPAPGSWRLLITLVTGPATAYAGTTTYQVR